IHIDPDALARSPGTAYPDAKGQLSSVSAHSAIDAPGKRMFGAGVTVRSSFNGAPVPFSRAEPTRAYWPLASRCTDELPISRSALSVEKCTCSLRTFDVKRRVRPPCSRTLTATCPPHFSPRTSPATMYEMNAHSFPLADSTLK